MPSFLATFAAFGWGAIVGAVVVGIVVVARDSDRSLRCRVWGHRIQNDPTYGFSYRMGVCTRCHRIIRPRSPSTGETE